MAIIGITYSIPIARFSFDSYSPEIGKVYPCEKRWEKVYPREKKWEKSDQGTGFRTSDIYYICFSNFSCEKTVDRER